ncbi:MAG TPA: hypothetical protein VL307_13260 [Chitinophagaceae bacterium]|nr:hypothetical protein [Chitinophagaceae bacterium]
MKCSRVRCAVIVSLLFFTSFFAAAQYQPLQKFIPPNYLLLDSASGDLDKDSLPDLVLVLKVNNEAEAPDTTRPLLLLRKNKAGLYALIARNDSVVLCLGCGGAMGDPYQGITIKNGYFSIEHYGGSSWRWSRIITFRYDSNSKRFILHRDAGESFHASNPNKSTKTLYSKGLAGKCFFENFSSESGW